VASDLDPSDAEVDETTDINDETTDNDADDEQAAEVLGVTQDPPGPPRQIGLIHYGALPPPGESGSGIPPVVVTLIAGIAGAAAMSGAGAGSFVLLRRRGII
jgi:hypothetical protein